MDILDFKLELATHLLRDARLQDSAPEQIGRGFDEFDARCPRSDHTLNTALSFWDSWIDERNHGFPGWYAGICREDWPKLGGVIASALRAGEELEEPRVLRHFAPSAKTPFWRKLWHKA